jgi:hypothetical protein
MSSKKPIVVDGSHSRANATNGPPISSILHPPEAYRSYNLPNEETGGMLPIGSNIADSAHIWQSQHSLTYTTCQPSNYPCVQAQLPSNNCPWGQVHAAVYPSPISNLQSNYQNYHTTYTQQHWLGRLSQNDPLRTGGRY